MESVTKEILKESFSKLGIKAGMKIIVHSSLKSFGHVEGGADTVIDALMELVTEEGTIVMPSFNHGRPYANNDIFDIEKTPTKNGIIPETFRKRSGVLRSINPTHSFAAWGKDHKRYVKDHQKYDCMGDNSPLSRLMADDAYCLLLGVGYDSNVFHHHAETMVGAPCISKRGEEYPVRLADGSIITAHTWGWRNGECYITDLAAYGEYMKPIEKRTKIGNADVILYKLSEGYKIICDCLENGINGRGSCKTCTIRPRVCKWTVE